MSTRPGQSPYGAPWSAPNREPFTWEPAADGERRSFAVPAAWGPGARAGSARITNLSRGTVYALNGSGRQADAATFDHAVAAYQTVTIVLDDDGLSASWSGTPGTAGGDPQRVQVELVEAPPGTVGSAAVAEPTFPVLASVAWFPNYLGGDCEVSTFLPPSDVLTVVSPPPNLNPGQTIVACAIENRTMFRLICRGDSASGPALAEIEPMTSSTILVGYSTLYVSTKGPGMNRGAPDQYVQFNALDVVPRLDPSASYPLTGVHEPGGSLLQFSEAVTVGNVGGLVHAFEPGKVSVINTASIAVAIGTAGALNVNSYELYLTAGFDGLSFAQRLLMATALADGTARSYHSPEMSLTGPLLVGSFTLPPAVTASELRVRNTAGTAPAVITATVSGWELPDIQ